MCKVFIIAGKTGAGKSTISEWLNSEYGFSVLSFSKIGKSFAKKYGKKRLRDCYLVLDPKEFKQLLIDEITESVNEAIIDTEVLVIDGLYSYDVISDIQNKCEIIVIYLQVNDITRYSRISKRHDSGNFSAIIEDSIKEEIKQILGNDRILESADYVIDGSKPIELVKKAVYDIVSKELYSVEKRLQ